MTWIVIPVALLLVAGLSWTRAGHGGRFGAHIRASDWYSWRDAVNEKERELAELKSADPRR